MDVKRSGATQDRPPSPNTREGGPWKTYTDEKKRERGRKDSEKKRERRGNRKRKSGA